MRILALLDCHLDVNCFTSDVHEVVKNATGLMSFNGGYSCTGTLLTDNDGETWMPYFITARHCLSTQAEVDTLEVTWGYETDFCEDDGFREGLGALRGVHGTIIRPRSAGGQRSAAQTGAPRARSTKSRMYAA